MGFTMPPDTQHRQEVHPGPLAQGYYAILDTVKKQMYFGDVH